MIELIDLPVDDKVSDKELIHIALNSAGNICLCGHKGTKFLGPYTGQNANCPECIAKANSIRIIY